MSVRARQWEGEKDSTHAELLHFDRTCKSVDMLHEIRYEPVEGKRAPNRAVLLTYFRARLGLCHRPSNCGSSAIAEEKSGIFKKVTITFAGVCRCWRKH